MATSTLTNPQALISDLNGIRNVLHTNTSKIQKRTMLNMFMDDYRFSDQSRLLVADLIDTAFAGTFDGEHQFSYIVAWQIDILIIRAQRGEYS